MEILVKERSKWSWAKPAATILALAAGLFAALVGVGDTFVLHNYMIANDRFTSLLTYLLYGSWIGVPATLLYNRLVGRRLVKEFQREAFVSWKVQLPLIISGISAAVYTVVYFIVAKDGDPSPLIALANSYVVYLMAFNFAKNRIAARKGGAVEPFPVRNTAISCILVLGGSTLTTVSDSNTGLKVTLTIFLLLAVVRGVFEAVSRIFEAKADDYTTLPNLIFWRFLWLAVASTIVAPIILIARGTFDQFLALLGHIWLYAIPVVALIMLANYGDVTARVIAQRKKTVAVTAIYRAIQSALAVPLAILFATILPECFAIPLNLYVWVVRIAGCAILVWGIATFPEPPKEKEI